MRRVAILLTVLHVVVPLFAGSASAAEKGIRRYRAEASDGQVLRFRTVRDGDERRLDAVFFGEGTRAAGPEGPVFELTCDDGTTKQFGGAGFAEWPWYFEGRTVTVEEWSRGDNWALHIEGMFGASSGSGTLQYSEVSLNEDHTARLCTTGDLTWTAERVA